MKQYKHLTPEQRYYIWKRLQEKICLSCIAREIGVSKSTISREIKRNKGKKSYRYKQAQRLALQRLQKPQYKKLDDSLKTTIEKKIREQWSPEQLSGWLELNYVKSFSTESIYQYILMNKKQGGDLWKDLRRANKRYKKRYGKIDNRGIIAAKTMISERDSIVDKKQRIGDLEIDTIIGKRHKGAIVTIVDRISKFVIALPVVKKTAEAVSKKIQDALSSYKAELKTITSDNGEEFAYHKELAKALDVKYYFANPYASWERGLSEHTNGLLRQYFPKQMYFDKLSKEEVREEVREAVDKLNHRPRKTLGYKTPFEVFFNEINNNQSVALET